MKIEFTVNGTTRALEAPPMKRLLDVLREDLSLTGTKEGCGEGECGACSVVVDGAVINSCLVPVCQTAGAQMLTVEGLAHNGRLHPLQQAFLVCGGAQCGICTPGMLIAAHALLTANPHPTRDEIKEAIAGNLCRCTGYVKIIDAIEQGAKDLGLGTTPAPSPKPQAPLNHSPTTLAAAYDLLAERAGSAKIFAGGTDLMVLLNAHLLDVPEFIDVWRVDELRGVTDEGDALRIGALTTYTQLINSPLIQQYAPSLVAAARTVGAVQIQNRGTIGGNIVNASPAGDTLPVLAAFDAEVEIGGVRGTRRVNFMQFYRGYRRTVLALDELVTAVRLPKLLADERTFFHKVGTRKAQAISKTVMAVKAKVTERTIDSIAIGLGSVAPTVIRAPRTEALLTGAALAPAIVELARQSMADEVSPITDVRSTEHYRRTVTGNVLGKFLRQLL